VTSPVRVRTVVGMAAIGADPEALDELARALDRAGDELASVAARVDAALRRTDWDGPDAARFRHRWTGAHRRHLRAQAARCRSLARQVSRHAGEQRRAALSTGAPTDGARLPDVARSGRVLHGTMAASVGPWSASVSGTLRVDDLGDRRRVTYEDRQGAGIGISGGTGFRAMAGERVVAAGTTADAGVSATSTVRRTWTVEPDDLTTLLAALTLHDAVEAASGPMGRVRGHVLRAVDVLTGGRLPAPSLDGAERTEDLVAVELGAAGWAALGAGSSTSRTAAGELSGRLAVGVAREGRDRWLLLEADGAAAAGIGSLLGDPTGLLDAAGTVRVEVPVGGDARPLLVTATSDDGDGEQILRLALDGELAAPALDAGRRAIEALRRGDVDAAARALRSVRWDAGATAIEVSTVERTPSTAGFDAAVGPGSVRLDGTDEEWERRP
jgi:hypothetical protein